MNESKPDINKILFMHLVSMLAMSAIQQMGKLVDPNTGKAETNLEAAQATIDMLDMLELKTRGNLDAEESKLIKDTLMSLKMNYVESQEQKPESRGQKSEVNSQQSEVGGQQSAIPPTPNAESKTKQDTSAGEDKTPKYHKKYE